MKRVIFGDGCVLAHYIQLQLYMSLITLIPARLVFVVFISFMSLILTACSPKPLAKYSTNISPITLMSLFKTDTTDGRKRFREIFCAITDTRGAQLPDYRKCNNALVRLSNEPPAEKHPPVYLGKSNKPLRVLIIPGLGWSCFRNFLSLKHTANKHLIQFGHEVSILEIEALSSSARNAQLIRNAVVAMVDSGSKPLVLIGYSKGAPDIMEAIVTYPEIQSRIAAFVSTAGAIGGSHLANDASQSSVNLLTHFPGSECEIGDEGGLESMKPEVRQRWLSNHQLPDSIRYYSLITYPDPDNISYMLVSSYNKLSQVDVRNDSQLIFYDQIIPGSTLLGYLNADHWAVSVPIARSHTFIGSTIVDKNAFPREVLLEAIVRYVEEDLAITAD